MSGKTIVDMGKNMPDMNGGSDLLVKEPAEGLRLVHMNSLVHPDIKGMLGELVVNKYINMIKAWQVSIQNDDDSEPVVLSLVMATEEDLFTMFRHIRTEVDVEINDRKILLRPR